MLAVYSVGATIYVPRLFSTYATRYGVIGAVFAMISALFCVMVLLVVSAAAGREVRDELGRIRRGEKPAEDEVQRQWAEVTAQARSRWETLRVQLEERRRSVEMSDEHVHTPAPPPRDDRDSASPVGRPHGWRLTRSAWRSGRSRSPSRPPSVSSAARGRLPASSPAAPRWPSWTP